MVARQRKSRTTPSDKQSKGQHAALETAGLLTRERTVVNAQDTEEPGPEPITQHVARLESKVQELGEENERLKEQVEKLEKKQCRNITSKLETKSKLKRKWTKKPQTKAKSVAVRSQPKRKAAKA